MVVYAKVKIDSEEESLVVFSERSTLQARRSVLYTVKRFVATIWELLLGSPVVLGPWRGSGVGWDERKTIALKASIPESSAGFEPALRLSVVNVRGKHPVRAADQTALEATGRSVPSGPPGGR